MTKKPISSIHDFMTTTTNTTGNIKILVIWYMSLKFILNSSKAMANRDEEKSDI